MGSEVEPQAVAWLWPGWLAHGKLHILAGRPGSLKTTTAIGFCAAVTAGGQWPDRAPVTPGKVVIWSGEDAVDDTLMPRFIAAGGDRAQVAFFSVVEEDGKTRSFDPSRDIDGIADVCAGLGNVKLIVIDPVVAVAKGDSHKNAEARRDLQPLVNLAERTGAALLGIHHLTKRSEAADPLGRVSGSLAFGAGPRVVMLNALDGKTSGPHGVLMHAKNNLGLSHGGYDYTAETRPLDEYPEINAQRILWGEYVNEQARDILERLESKEDDQNGAEAFVLGALNDGPQNAADVIAKGEAAGFSERVLQRARKNVGVTTKKKGMEQGWVWVPPVI